MADYLLEKKTDLIAIADAIRNKTSATDTMKITEMPTLINNINGASDVLIGDKKVSLGEFTPTSAGSYNVNIGLPPNTSIYLVAFWLKDKNVTSKYTNDTIMVNAIRFSSQYCTFSYVANGEGLSSQVKSSFGITNIMHNGFSVTSHDNWKIQPETYQYIVLYN